MLLLRKEDVKATTASENQTTLLHGSPMDFMTSVVQFHRGPKSLNKVYHSDINGTYSDNKGCVLFVMYQMKI